MSLFDTYYFPYHNIDCYECVTWTSVILDFAMYVDQNQSLYMEEWNDSIMHGIIVRCSTIELKVYDPKDISNSNTILI